MPGFAEYREALSELSEGDWEDYVREHAGLPEDAVDLGLVRAAAQQGMAHQFQRWVRMGAGEAPNDAPGVALVMAGTLGLGRLVAKGEDRHTSTLRTLASDPRWRVREAVTMALRRIGRADAARLIEIAEDWIDRGPFDQRAAVAAMADPGLVHDPDRCRRALDVLDQGTEALQQARTHDDEGLVALREALGRAWSVVVAASPETARPRFEAWMAVDDPDVRWVLEENLKTERMEEIDPEWARRTRERLGKARGSNGPRNS